MIDSKSPESAFTHLKSQPNPAIEEPKDAGFAKLAEPQPLENVVAMICADARRRSMTYAIRSNVGHSGE